MIDLQCYALMGKSRIARSLERIGSQAGLDWAPLGTWQRTADAHKSRWNNLGWSVRRCECYATSQRVITLPRSNDPVIGSLGLARVMATQEETAISAALEEGTRHATSNRGAARSIGSGIQRTGPLYAIWRASGVLLCWPFLSRAGSESRSRLY